MYDLFKNETDTMNIIYYLSQTILKEFLTKDIIQKINLIHFQINKSIERFFPKVWYNWKKNGLNSEIILSSFVISLFSCCENDSKQTVLEFWDVILVEGWFGFIKCILFIIHYYYDKLISIDMSDSLRFFSDLKGPLGFLQVISSFKQFNRFFDLTEEYLTILERIYKTINRNDELLQLNNKD